MSLIFKSRVKETSTTTGTGYYSLAGASTGFQAFSTIGAGNQTFYAATNLTQVGSTGAYKYDASGSERTTAGEAVVVQVTATIDSSSRTWRKVVSRDA